MASSSYAAAVKLLDDNIAAGAINGDHGRFSQLLSNRAYCYEQLHLNRKVSRLHRHYNGTKCTAVLTVRYARAHAFLST